MQTSAGKTEAGTWLRDIIVAWEKRRIIYNLCLFVVGAASVGLNLLTGDFSLVQLFCSCIAYAVAANAFYTLGPTAELYVAAFHKPVPRLRNVLFGIGLAGSLLLTALIPFAVRFSIDLKGFGD